MSMRKGLNEILKTTQAGLLRPEEAIERLNTQVIEVLQRGTYLAAVPRIGDLIGRDILANASSNAAYTDDIVAPKPKLVDQWVRRVKHAKRNNRQKPTEMAFEADGAALAQLALLNADWEKTREVFILITDDHGLHNAYKSWIGDSRDSGEPIPFHPLRYCKQFAPILNVRDMGGIYDHAYVFADIRRAVWRFAETFMSGDAPLNHAGGQDLSDASHVPSAAEIGEWLENQLRLSVDAQSDLSAALPARVRDLEAEIKLISAKWIYAMRMVVLAKIDVLLDYAEVQLDRWSDQLKELEFDKAFRANIGSLTDAFDKSTAASAMLRHEFYVVQMAPQADKEVADHGRRIVASTFTDFKSPIFQGQTIQSLTAKVSRDAKPLDFLAEATIVEERWLVLGALCLEIGAWRGAVSLLNHASERIADRGRRKNVPALSEEIDFHLCVARRVAATHITWSREYPALRDILKGLLDKEPEDLARARVISELFALRVSTFAWISDNEDAALKRAVDEALSLWKGPLGAEIRNGAHMPMWARLRSQVCLNMLILAFWTIQIKGVLDARLASVVEFALAEADHPDRDPTHHALHLPIYPALLRFALLPDGPERLEPARELKKKLEDVLRRDLQKGYAFEVANVDKAEFRKIRSILSKAITAADGPTDQPIGHA